MIQKDGAPIAVIDPRGNVFDLVSRACPELSLQRIGLRDSANGGGYFALAIVAIYRPGDWQQLATCSRELPTVAMTPEAHAPDAHRVRAAGGFGLLHCALAPAALHRAIVGAVHGEPAFSRAVLGELIKAELNLAYMRRIWELTPRQREVGGLIASGATDREIAGSLGISTSTAQKHVQGLLRRLGVTNRAAAVAAMMA